MTWEPRARSAEADGNRTRLGALAPTPVLKTGGPTRRPDASAAEDNAGWRREARHLLRTPYPGYGPRRWWPWWRGLGLGRGRDAVPRQSRRRGRVQAPEGHRPCGRRPGRPPRSPRRDPPAARSAGGAPGGALSPASPAAPAAPPPRRGAP